MDDTKAARRHLAARIGALSRVAQHGGAASVAAPRAAFVAKFEREVDPDGILPLAERQRRAKAALTAHMLRMAAKSAEARRKT